MRVWLEDLSRSIVGGMEGGAANIGPILPALLLLGAVFVASFVGITFSMTEMGRRYPRLGQSMDRSLGSWSMLMFVLAAAATGLVALLVTPT